MAIHDAYLRRTPYELAFPDVAHARERFAAFEAEAEERGTPVVDDPEAFVMLGSVGRSLRELRGPGEDPALIAQHGRLLWHAYRLWKVGELSALVSLPAVRRLLDSDADAPWQGELPAAAGYLQLPQHLVWIRPDEEATPESLDGFFWAQVGDDRLALLLVVGIRGDRPGFSVVPLDDLPLEEASSWTSAAMRPGGGDFVSTLPGAELEGLHELRSAGEAVKLAARCLGLWERTSAEARPPAAGAAGAARGAPGAGPRPSGLVHRIIDVE